MRAPGCSSGTIRSSGRPCRMTQAHVLHRPAEPRRGEAEGGGRREADDLAGGTRRASVGADAVAERVAGGEHATSAGRAGRGSAGKASVERAGPGQRLAADERRRKRRCRAPPTTSAARVEGARAAGDSPSSPSSPMPTIASQAPAGAALDRRAGRSRTRRACACSFSAARRRPRACAARSPAAAGSTATLSLAGRTDGPEPRPCRRDRRLRRPGGAGALARATNRIEAVVDATHPFAGAMSRHAAAACAAAAGAAARPRAGRPGGPSAGDRWTEVADMRGRPPPRSAPAPRRVFLTIGRRSSRRSRRRRSTATSCAAIDPPDALPLPGVTRSAARGPFERSRRARAAAGAWHRDRW